jgi:hypothetical protein
MSACEKVNALLGAYLDGELDEAERIEVSLHLKACEPCRLELRDIEATQCRLKEHFTGWMAEAPPAPRTVLDESRGWPPASDVQPGPAGPKDKARSIIMKTLTGIAAAVVLTATVYFLIPGEKVAASPGELIQRAAANYLNWSDVELELSIHLKGLDILARLSEDDKLESEDLLGKVRILLQAPHRVLIHPDGKANGFPLVDGLFGFDGTHFWTYDAEEKAVKLGDADPESSDFSYTYSTSKTKTKHTMKIKKDTNFMRFLSWDFMEQLNRESENLAIEEVTSPYDGRVGRRVFEVKRSFDDKDGEKDFFEKMFWTRSRITIDPEEGLVERYELEVKFSFISLLSFKVEVVDVNQGYAREFFHWSSHVPEDTPVIEAPPDEEESAEGGE